MKPIVISGNGVSLKSIDYLRLPKEFDVFRCNTFFLESEYYLGKKITGYFSHVVGYPNLLFITMILEQEKEYFIQDHYFVSQNLSRDLLISHKFSFLLFTWNIIMGNKKISQFISLYFNILGKWPTTGIIMLFTAVALGYKEIYCIGIDFYQTDQMYAFDVDSSDKFGYHIDKEISLEKSYWHSLDLEKRALELVLSMEDINLYSLSNESPISKLISMAPIQNDTPYQPEKKSLDYISDETLRKFFSNSQIQNNIENLKQELKRV